MTTRVVKIGQSTIRVADDQPTFWDRVERGTWEAGTLTLIRELVGSDTVFVDVGAWVGPTTLYAALSAQKVVAVEADPAALDQLRRNLTVNPDLAARIELVPRAVAARPGPVTMTARRKPGDSMSSTLLRGGVSWQAASITPEQLATLIPPSARLVLKMDIEGGEYDLLPALQPLLARADAVLVSFHPDLLAEALQDAAREASHRLRAALRALAGFRGFPVTPRGRGPGSIRPFLVRLGMTGRLGAKEWLFQRRSGFPPPPRAGWRERAHSGFV